MERRPTGDLGEIIMAEAYNREFTPWENCETTKGCAKGQLDCHTTGTVARHAKKTRHGQLVFHITVKPLSNSTLKENEGSQKRTHQEEWKSLKVFIHKTAPWEGLPDKKGKRKVPQGNLLDSCPMIATFKKSP